jgi:hypothetical protein
MVGSARDESTAALGADVEFDVEAATTDAVGSPGGFFSDAADVVVVPEGFATVVESTLDADRPRSQTKSAAWDPSRTRTTAVITICFGLKDRSEPISPVDHAAALPRAYFV